MLAGTPKGSALVGLAIGLVILVLVFWPMPGNGKANIRQPDTSLPDDQAVDFEKLLRDNCPATGDRYLVVGTGFLGITIISPALGTIQKNTRPPGQ